MEKYQKDATRKRGVELEVLVKIKRLGIQCQYLRTVFTLTGWPPTTMPRFESPPPISSRRVQLQVPISVSTTNFGMIQALYRALHSPDEGKKNFAAYRIRTDDLVIPLATSDARYHLRLGRVS